MNFLQDFKSLQPKMRCCQEPNRYLRHPRLQYASSCSRCRAAARPSSENSSTNTRRRSTRSSRSRASTRRCSASIRIARTLKMSSPSSTEARGRSSNPVHIPLRTCILYNDVGKCMTIVCIVHALMRRANSYTWYVQFRKCTCTVV